MPDVEEILLDNALEEDLEEEDFPKEGQKEKRGRPPSRKRKRPKRRKTRFRPGGRQRRQKPAEKNSDRFYYRKKRGIRLDWQNAYYEKNKDNPHFQDYLEHKQKYPHMHERRASAEKIAAIYLASYYLHRSPPEDSPRQWRDMEPRGVPTGKFDPIDLPEGTVNWPDGKARDEKIPAHRLDVDSYGGPGSSAKVIPYSGDLVNHTDWKSKNATMNMDQLLASTDEDVIDRGHEYWPILYRKGPLFLYFEVGDYRVRCHFPNLPLQDFRDASFPEDLDVEDVQFDCSCQFWRWQGPEHWARVYGYDLADPRGTASVPHVRDPQGRKLVCKHVSSVISYLLSR